MQAAAEIVALIISVIALLQTKKIKELVEITQELSNQTKELQNQNAVLQKRFDLEMALSVDQRMPFFEPSSITTTRIMMNHSIVIKNIGKKAFKIMPFINDNSNYKANVSETSCEKGCAINITIQFYKHGQLEISKFDFTISFYDNFNNGYQQRIRQVDNDFILDAPEWSP